jgi:hypothetical protein
LTTVDNINQVTALICGRFEGESFRAKCEFYNSDHKAMVGPNSSEATASLLLAYFLPLEEYHCQARKEFNYVLQQLNVDEHNLAFAVGNSIEYCYYFSPENINELAQPAVGLAHAASFFNSHFGKTRTWEEACATEKKPCQIGGKQRETWKLFVAALATFTGLGALLYIKRNSIRAWLSGSQVDTLPRKCSRCRAKLGEGPQMATSQADPKFQMALQNDPALNWVNGDVPLESDFADALQKLIHSAKNNLSP